MPMLQPLALLLSLALAAREPLALGQPEPANPPERAAGFHATVLSVGDGDTLRVSRDGQTLTVRLACIDAPELAQSPWGYQSRAYLLQRLRRGRQVRVIPHATDRYGRTVAEVISDLSINLVMVEDGQAFVYRRYLQSCDAKEYLEAEYRACRQRFGVWQVPGGITRPWAFRRHQAALQRVLDCRIVWAGHSSRGACPSGPMMSRTKVERWSLPFRGAATRAAPPC